MYLYLASPNGHCNVKVVIFNKKDTLEFVFCLISAEIIFTYVKRKERFTVLGFKNQNKNNLIQFSTI